MTIRRQAVTHKIDKASVCMLEDTYVSHLLHLYANKSKINLKIIKIIVDTRKLGPILGTKETGERLPRLIPSAGSDQGRL